MIELAKKLSNNQIKALIKEYDNGFGATPSDLSAKYNVHPSTIRRYLREAGETLRKSSHKVLISDSDKFLLRKILVNNKVKNPDKLISELDSKFIFSRREDKEEFITFNL